MIYAVYQNEDGRLVSSTQDETKLATADILAARGYSVAQRPDSELNGIWNPATLVFDPAPAMPVLVSPDQFLDLFTAAEVQRCYASAEPNLEKLLRRLQIRFEPLDLLSPTVARGLGLIALLGLYDDQNGVPGAPTTRPADIQAWRP